MMTVIKSSGYNADPNSMLTPLKTNDSSERRKGKFFKKSSVTKKRKKKPVFGS